MGEGRPLRRLLGGCLGLLFFGGAALLVEGGLDYALDYVFNPWAHSLTRRPTLAGTWVGRVTSPSGQARVLFLDLHRSTGGGGRYTHCKTCPRIEGAAELCGGADVNTYDVWGGPDAWSGSRFHLNYPRIKGQPRAGLQVGSIRGEWSGDALNLSMKFGFRNERADVYDSSNPDVNVPSRFTMARGTESDFLGECRRLGAGK